MGIRGAVLVNSYLTREQIEQILRRTIWQEDGCWIFSGAKNPEGYGVVKIGGRSGRTHLTHRLTFARYIGPLDPALQIDHLCRVRACCNPLHLEQVTPKVNSQRSRAGLVASIRAQQVTHCPQGHPYDAINTYYSPSAAYRHRQCLVCRRARSAAYNRKVAAS